MLMNTYVKARRGRKRKEKAEKKEIHYTYNEAMNVVLDLANKRGGTFPLDDDYVNAEEDGKIDIDGLAEALGVVHDIKRTGVRPYAAINIEVLRTLRECEGRSAYAGGIDNGYLFFGEATKEREEREKMMKAREEAKAKRRQATTV